MSIRNVTVVGLGVIGQSWASLFAKNGLAVTAADVRPDLGDLVNGINATLPPDATPITWAPLADAVAHADLVQEAGPERLDAKQELYAQMSQAAPGHTIFASSSSGIPTSAITANLADTVAARTLIGHPFNPPELMPLVELVPSERTSPETVTTVKEFYVSLGKVPIPLSKEIPGFVINRLQWAITKEASYLVKQGVVTPEQLDDAVRASVGIRWASVGPFLAFHQGSAHGYRGITEHVLSTFDDFTTEDVKFGDPAYEPVVKAVEDSYGPVASAESKSQRDARLVAISKALAEVDPQ